MAVKEDYNSWTKQKLQGLCHNKHEQAFQNYLHQSSHARDKHEFLFSWIAPKKEDVILECGCSGGKTSVDLSRKSGCYILGVDFDPHAIQTAASMRDKYFPELKNSCDFVEGDLESMKFTKQFTKVVMADFTEHIPDRVFQGILMNIQTQLPNAVLYIYTPCRTHLFELIKCNIIKNQQSGHINLKTEKELKVFLAQRGWKIIEQQWRPSHFPVFNVVERFFGWLPVIGLLLHRRIAIKALCNQ
jgi:cyclopropane fatty-acyl-phospholipid synthase-like methyltransferase